MFALERRSDLSHEWIPEASPTVLQWIASQPCEVKTSTQSGDRFIGQGFLEVTFLQIGVGFENNFLGMSRSHQAHNRPNGDTHPANAGFPPHHLGIERDSRERLHPTIVPRSGSVCSDGVYNSCCESKTSDLRPPGALRGSGLDPGPCRNCVRLSGRTLGVRQARRDRRPSGTAIS